MRYKRLCDSHVWCDLHGEIHLNTDNPYLMVEERCGDHHRRVYIETDDPDEQF